LAVAEEETRDGAAKQVPEEFRRNAAKLALDGGRSIRDVACELGVNRETLSNWVEALRRDGPAAVSGEGVAVVLAENRADMAE
jgi:transposase